MLFYLISTKFKIRVANLLYHMIRLVGIRRVRTIEREGIRYQVDLAEGIDLSLFLFGHFQKHVTHNKLFTLPQNGVALDVGANFGVTSLSLLSRYPSAIIYAFEPTDYAFEKLNINLDLNPEARSRIKPFQLFVSDHESPSKEFQVYSSWRVDKLVGEIHPIHCGNLKSASCKTVTIDGFVHKNNIDRLDFIKIDTDGNELSVLRGAKEVLCAFRPVIVFEITTYLLDENQQSFSEDFLDLLTPIGYTVFDSVSGIQVTDENIRQIVPPEGSIDLVAVQLDSRD